MKKVFLLLAVLLVVLPLSARPKLEFSPRGSVYISSVNVGVGADIIVNPMKNLGVRVNIAELIFGDNTTFSINMLNQFNYSNFDILYYTNIADLFSYIDLTFGLLSNGGTTIVIGGGLGLEKYMGKGNYLFFEPNLSFKSNGENDLTLELQFGFKTGI